MTRLNKSYWKCKGQKDAGLVTLYETEESQSLPKAAVDLPLVVEPL